LYHKFKIITTILSPSRREARGDAWERDGLQGGRRRLINLARPTGFDSRLSRELKL